MTDDRWPDLGRPDLSPTLETLHLWTQVVGKVKLATLPWLSESWHVPLYVSSRGLTTGAIALRDAALELSFDLLSMELRVATSAGRDAVVALEPQSVASFHSRVTWALASVGFPLDLSPAPCEIEGAIPFAQDHSARAFAPDAARAFWRALIQAQRVFHIFRSRFSGKCSPIHFFWGSFDLAVTRFSGRAAPAVERGGPNFSVAVARDAYANEQASCGFWPGGAGFDEPGFYVEAWPVPDGFGTAAIGPTGARYVETLGEWVLPYAAMRASADPDAALLEFLQSGYEAIAIAGHWDRDRLERAEGPVGHPPKV